MFVATLARVDGDSMEPTLHHGDLVVLLRPALDSLTWRRDGYRVGDVVAVRTPAGGAALKRVVALGPATVAIVDGELLIDGQESLTGSFDGYQLHGDSEAAQVAPGELYVIGDNRRPLASNDSRAYGPLGTAAVRGRLVIDFGR